MSSYSVIGCGYVGSFVAANMKSQGHYVVGTTRTSQRFAELRNVVSEPISLDLSEPNCDFSFLEEQQGLLISVAPTQNGDGYQSVFSSGIRNLARALRCRQSTQPLHVTYISSAGVYGDHRGETVTEDSSVDSVNPVNAMLVEAENVLLTIDRPDTKICVMRLGGIYGPGRDMVSMIKQAAGEQIQLISNTGAVVATHSTPQAPSNVQRFLRVSELHYHPSQLSDAEFIELTNISQADQATLLDLSGVQISEGPSEPFVFPPGTRLEPGESWLVVKDTNAFVTAFPTADINRIAGNFVGRLNNQGERIKVDDATGSTVLQFTYQDQAPWPNQADGQGASLQLVNLTNDPNDPSNWQAIQPTPGLTQSITADLNQDGQVNEADITRMCHLITTTDQAADFNGNGSVGMEDVRFFIETAMGTDVGDANLDGRFDSADFVLVFQAGEYEDQTIGNSTWSEGDWKCDGDFATEDEVFAVQAGGFSLAAQPQLPIPAAIAAARLRSEQNARDPLNEGQQQPNVTTADTQSPSALRVREMVFLDWGLQASEDRKRTLIGRANQRLATSTTSTHDLLLQEVDDHHFDRSTD